MDDQLIITIIMFVIMFPILMTAVIMYGGQHSDKLRNFLSLFTVLITFIGVLLLYPEAVSGRVFEYQLFEVLPGLAVSFRLDILSYCLVIISSFVWLLAAIYSIGYMAKEHSQLRYYAVLIFTLGSCLGIFLAGDFFTLFIFFELMSLIAYVLVIHEETAEALKAGYKYLVVTIIGGLAIFFGVIICFEAAGTVSIGEGPLITEASSLAWMAFFAFLIGFGIKAGMFPLHVWLPDAHPVAPSPASALLSGIMLKTGAYGLLRMVFDVFSPELMQAINLHAVMMVLGIITIILGSAVALTQDDIKRRLAYSSIGQMGYVVLGMTVFNEQVLTGDIFHIFTHAIMKSTLFLAAGAIIWKSGIKKVSGMAGLGRQMPVTFGCFTVAAFAMIGIPPLNGFLSKWSLCLGFLEDGYIFFVVILLLSSMLNAMYYLPIILPAFLGKEEIEKDLHVDDEGPAFNINEASKWMLIPMVVLALCVFLFGTFPSNIPFELSNMAAKFLLTGGF